MLKKLALPVVALVAMLSLASAPAQAAVKFGVTIGPPVYTYPAYPYYPAPYVDPYASPYYYRPAPVYSYPSFGLGFGFGGHRDNRGHGWQQNRGQDFRGHDNHGGNGGNNNRGGHRR